MPITSLELGLRLRAARTACGLTQEDVSRALGIARPAVVQLEKGARAVTSLELDRLAHLFGRDLREFLAESFDEQDVVTALFRADPDVLGQPPTLAAFRDCVALAREVRRLEILVGLDSVATPVVYPDLRLTSRWEAVEQGERVAADERHRLDLGSGALPDVTDMLEEQGVRTAIVDLPEAVSGVTLADPASGLFVVVNRAHHVLRRRFSFAHEYAHVLLDRGRLDRGQSGLVSRARDNETLPEIRANAFAAAFLLPADGVRECLTVWGRGQPSRPSSEIFDETGSVRAEGRLAPGSQRVRLRHVVQLAHRFGASRRACLYRLRNLGLITQAELDHFLGIEADGHGREIAAALGLPEPDHTEARSWFRHRVVDLALEAWRREEISRGRVLDLLGRAGIARVAAERILVEAVAESSADGLHGARS